MKSDWDEEVLDFWFRELSEKDWYSGGDAVDDQIRQRFQALHTAIGKHVPSEALSAPRAALAATIVLDQFPRNIYRRQPNAFASDDLALQVARNAVDAGFDKDMTRQERQFLYMPFMHSESLADQELAVSLFRDLGNDKALEYAIEHRDIIARFGRFPHRNRVLERQSTAEEDAFLVNHDGYGQ